MNKKKKLLLLLQQNYDGTLPPGFTELEYLESSGTQYIRPDLKVEGLSYRTKATVTKSISCTVAGYYDTTTISQGECTSVWTDKSSTENTYNAGIRFFGKDLSGKRLDRYNIPLDTIFEAELNWHEKYLWLYAGTESKTTINVGDGFTNKAREILIGAQSTSINGWNPDRPIGNSFQGFLVGKLYSFKAWYEPGVMYRDLVPVLNADGEPGMWDKVSKRFFGNDGTGTFGYALKGQRERSTYSLRNPGVVPPSGVYARKNGENELEILADTEETTGAGWEWFANTAEAYEHFGIVPVDAEQFPN